MGRLTKAACSSFIFLFFQTSVHAQDRLAPQQHYRIEEVAKLSKMDAEKIYQDMIADMAAGYAQSDDPVATEFQDWQRFNSAPYLSAGHGNRYLNNYGNALSKGYLDLEKGQKMPAGAVLVKDSFTVTSNGETHIGAFFIMEKLADGANEDTGDWRYAMIMPDGSILGDTTGDDPQAMNFCHACHQAVERTDYLFKIPRDYR